MSDLLTGGAGAGGAVLGALVAFFGLKSRVKKLEDTEDRYVSKDFCNERHASTVDRLSEVRETQMMMNKKLDEIKICLTKHVAKDK